MKRALEAIPFKPSAKPVCVKELYPEWHNATGWQMRVILQLYDVETRELYALPSICVSIKTPAGEATAKMIETALAAHTNAHGHKVSERFGKMNHDERIEVKNVLIIETRKCVDELQEWYRQVERHEQCPQASSSS